VVSKKILTLAAIVAITGIVTIQASLAYAVSAEKVPLVQHYEQFSGQEVTGFCNVKVDTAGNLHWQIRVSGLVPETQGIFDLNHWAGEEDVSFTADEDGNADSGKQIVLEEDVPHPIFTQFAACTVHAAGDSHYDALGIATAELETI
jgi:hypothetical protein